MGMNYPITLYVSKSTAAKKLGINRKTIQRKVQSGKLSQDGKGRIRWDELVAVLKSEEMRGRRGPKTPIPPVENTQKIHHYDPKRGLFEATLEPNEAILWNQKLNEIAVAHLTSQMANLSTTSLEAVVKSANTLIEHKSRLAKVGLLKPGAELLAVLDLVAPSSTQKLTRSRQATKKRSL